MKQNQFSIGSCLVFCLVFLYFSTSITGAEEQESRSREKISLVEPATMSNDYKNENDSDQISRNMTKIISSEIFGLDPATQEMTYNFASVPDWPYEKVYRVSLNEPYNFNEEQMNHNDKDTKVDFSNFFKFLVCYAFSNDCMYAHGGWGVEIDSAKCKYTSAKLKYTDSTCNAFANCKSYLSEKEQVKLEWIFNNVILCHLFKVFRVTNCHGVLSNCKNDATNTHGALRGKCCLSSDPQCFPGPQYSYIPNCPCAEGILPHCVLQYY